MYKNILLPIDLDDERSAKLGTARAVDLVRASGGRLRLMTVVPDFGMSIVSAYFPEDFEKKALEETRQKLHEFASANVPEGVDVQCVVGHGTIYQEILSSAEASSRYGGDGYIGIISIRTKN